MISCLLVILIHISVEFFLHFMLIVLVGGLGFNIGSFVFSCYLVVIMVSLGYNYPFDGLILY